MSEVIIKEVKGKRMLRKFVTVPNVMYKDVPEFIPSFYGDDLADWNSKKNPAASYCESKAYLAYKDGKIVGRVGAILSKRSNEKAGTKRMRFSQLDFIDDPEVSAALLKAVEDFAREKGCNEVHGPLGFTDMDREGLLVDGFDKRGMFITYYNYPYYIDHLTGLGYKKDVDWIEYKIYAPSTEDEFYQKIHRIAERVLKRGKWHKVILTKQSQYKPYIRKVFNLVNEAYSPLYGTVELDEKQIKKYADKFCPLINPDYCALVVDDDDNLVAFGVCAASVAKAIKKSNGRLFPFGWIGVLRALKSNEPLDMLLMAVKPELQGSGLNAVIIDHVMCNALKKGVKYAETGPQLELNEKMTSQWKIFAPEPYKRRRCFIKSL